jgi:lipid-A-disaccharide synthase
MSKKIFISAGDTSGDIHAAKLIKSIKKIDQSIEFIGIGGSEMEKTGFKSIVPLKDISVVGFLEVAKKISFFRKLMDQCLEIIENQEIDLFLPVDYPGFNIELAKRLKKKLKTKVIYYIAPQLWAWGKNRAEKLVNNVDLLLVVFPFEEEFFSKYKIKTSYVGHPLMDDDIFKNKIKSYDERDYSCIYLPGSRNQEIIKHLPLLNATAIEIKKYDKNLKHILVISNNIDKQLININLSDKIDWILSTNSKEAMANSLVGNIKTGTSTLEAALLGLPYNMYYLTSFLTYFMGKKMINLDYISLPNILFKKEIVREYIQKDANFKELAKGTLQILNNKTLYKNIQKDFNKLREYIGSEGASNKAANIILDNI